MKSAILASILAFACSLLQARAQDLQLPQNPRAWLNSPPVSQQALKGKGVVFYFFEEG